MFYVTTSDFSPVSHFDLGDVVFLGNKAWDCDYVSKTFPESRIRQEGGSSETWVIFDWEWLKMIRTGR